MATKYPKNGKNQVKVGKVNVTVVQTVLRSGRESIFLSTSAWWKLKGLTNKAAGKEKNYTMLMRVWPAANTFTFDLN